MASYAVKKRTDGKKKHYYWNDYRFEGGKIVKYRRIILVYFDGEKSYLTWCKFGYIVAALKKLKIQG